MFLKSELGKASKFYQNGQKDAIFNQSVWKYVTDHDQIQHKIPANLDILHWKQQKMLWNFKINTSNDNSDLKLVTKSASKNKSLYK